jgi:hypothetical protein
MLFFESLLDEVRCHVLPTAVHGETLLKTTHTLSIDLMPVAEDSRWGTLNHLEMIK